MLTAPAGTRTEAGLRHNIRVGIQYLEAQVATSAELQDFLTLPAYERLVAST